MLRNRSETVWVGLQLLRRASHSSRTVGLVLLGKWYPMQAPAANGNDTSRYRTVAYRGTLAYVGHKRIVCVALGIYDPLAAGLGVSYRKSNENDQDARRPIKDGFVELCLLCVNFTVKL